MLHYLARRFLQSLLCLAVITFLVFAMMYQLGDPVAMLLPRQASEAQREKLKRELGLDQPMIVQYGRFVGRLVRLDLGFSYYHGRPVTQILIERAPATIELAFTSILFATVVGIPLGLIAGARPRSLIARGAMAGSMLGISLPTFWLGLLMMMYFGVYLQWLPPFGRGATRSIGSTEWSFLTRDGLMHLIMPAANLALGHLAMLIRLVRSEMIDTLRRPFIRVARSRGLSEASIIGKHALRNSLIPIVTVTGVEFGQLLAFSVVTETIFQWPGLGKLLIDSIFVDRPLVAAYLMLTGVCFLFINFLVDLTYAAIDPRIRIAAPSAARGA